MTLAVAIYLFNEVEVLDFAGPYEVFTTASRVHQRKNPKTSQPFHVFTIARTSELVKARAGLVVQPDFTFESHPAIDVLIIPGGVVTSELGYADVVTWIQNQSQTAVVTASVCTGAFLLAQAGLLRSKSATTHWEDITDLKIMFPDTTVLENRLWVEQGSVVTSAGISAGIHMSLHLVERLTNQELANATARQMEFAWCRDS